MRRVALTIILSVVAGGSAFAADLPQAPPPQAPVQYVPAALPVYNWTGIYVGINGGWGFGSVKWSAIGEGGDAPAPVSSHANDNGGVVGGTLGANYQVGPIVYGLEGDWDYSGVNTGTSSTVCGTFGACQTGNNWLATVRGRIGFAADRVLFFGTGGGVFANMQTTASGVQTTHNQSGWTAGVGVEVAFADNWTAKLEYLYADLGNLSVTCSTGISGPCGTAAPATIVGPVNINASLTENLVRAGVNYKFNF
jgi:outer membrane immunogenic protein